MVGDGWTQSAAWSEAIALELFSDRLAGRAAYLDLEDDVLATLWERLGRPGASAQESLATTIRATLDLTPRGDVFGPHRIRLNAWETTGRRGHPPTLGLLAALSLAAESMATGEGMASTNYYGRLAQLLAIRDRPTASRLESSYREIALRLWGSLSDWLTSATAPADCRRPTPSGLTDTLGCHSRRH